MSEWPFVTDVSEGETWQLTSRLRFWGENKSTFLQGIGRLQQLWVCWETGKTEWRDVPYEHGD